MSIPHFLPILLLLPFLFSPSTSTSTTTTSLLNVSSSLSTATLLILTLSSKNLNPHQHHKFMFNNNNNNNNALLLTNLSLSLHSIDFLSNSPPTDYKSLTLSRLRRDSARASAISSRASPRKDAYRAADVEGPVVSGSRQGSGEYFCRVGVGSPAQRASLVLDTGSDVSWLQCRPCADCYPQSDPVFDPSASSSYSPLPCSSDSCRSLDLSACGRGGSCLYQVSYGDGSYTVGDFATETLTLGQSSPLSNVAIGCGHDNEGLFVGASGLLGLGGGALSFPSQISANSFSYCLVDRDSTSASTLAFFSSLPVPDTAVHATLLRSGRADTFYYVGLTGITVGGTLLPIPRSAFDMDVSGSGGVIVDSGTAVTRLQADAYAALRDAFVSGTGELARAAGVALFDTCYDLSGRRSVEVPTVGFVFGEGEGKELRLPAKNYLVPVDSVGTFCFAFAPTRSGPSIIGNVQQQGTRVTFDLQNSMVGFEGGKC